MNPFTPTPYCIVFCTCPSQIIAQKIARSIVEQKLAACTNIVPHLTSIYFWKENIEEGEEVLMIIKTRQDKLIDLEQAIVRLHPYEFPEFIAMPIIGGHQRYLSWIDEVVSSQTIKTQEKIHQDDK